MSRRFKIAALAVAVAGAAVGFAVWWRLFRVDPEFEKRDAGNKATQQEIDRALGVDPGADDFGDLEKALEAPKPP